MSVSTERFDRAIEMIGAMCSEGRPPKMSIPVQPDDEDIFITDTLREARDYIAELIEAVKAKDGLLICYRVGTRPSEALFARLKKADAALAKYRRPTDEREK